MPQTPHSAGGYNKNFYQAKEELYSGLYYHDNNLASGSLEALIRHLLPTVDYYPDIRLRKIAPKILQLLTEWTETFPYDFRDDRMMRSLKDLTHRLSTGDEIYRKAASQLSQGLIRRLTVLSQYEEALAKINATVAERLTVLKAKAHVHRDILSICNDPFTLAQQLTHIELERLSYIGPEEFVQAFVQKDPVDNDKGHFSDRKKAANLEAYVDWFNRLSYLVATEICMVRAGMNMSPVSRLKKTWSKVKTAKFDILEHQMDPSGNFYNYRTALRGATQRSITANSSREKMVIPFFSLLIKDIYFLNESCANRLHNGHINFQKLWELAKQVSEFMSWKAVQCPFDKDRKILHYLLTAPVYSEDASRGSASRRPSIRGRVPKRECLQNRRPEPTTPATCQSSPLTRPEYPRSPGEMPPARS
uniref:RasGEF domain family member 1B n=1 Tax=Hippocampus comes TaxID=109280 RepID=A0A3Q2YUU2_HIPCM